jgi:hypothetical protein
VVASRGKGGCDGLRQRVNSRSTHDYILLCQFPAVLVTTSYCASFPQYSWLHPTVPVSRLPRPGRPSPRTQILRLAANGTPITLIRVLCSDQTENNTFLCHVVIVRTVQRTPFVCYAELTLPNSRHCLELLLSNSWWTVVFMRSLLSTGYICHSIINGTLYPQKLAITSPTSGDRSVGIVRSRTQTMEFFLSTIMQSVSQW